MTATAGQTYSFELESRNAADIAHAADNDVDQILLTDTSNNVILTETALHRTGTELYDVTFVQTVPETYTVTVTLTNAFTGDLPTEIPGSPYTLKIYPGPPLPAMCRTSVTEGNS